MADPALHGRSATGAVAAMFVLNGMIIGGYGGVLPLLQIRFDLSASQISVLLFVGGAAAIAAMQIGGRLADSIGPRPVVLAGLPIMVAGASLLALAPSFDVVLSAGALIGFGGGAMDVAMNALGVQLERARVVQKTGGSILSLFHAIWSMGNLAGAGLALAVASIWNLHGARVIAPVLFSVAAVGVVGNLLLVRFAPHGTITHHETGGAKVRIPRAAYLLGATGLASGLAEGTAASWSSIHVTEVAHVDPVTGSLGLVAVSGCMVVVRVLGDRLVDRYGRRAVVRAGAVSALLGYLSVASSDHLAPLLVGWSAVGCGVGLLAPQVYGAAGHIGGGRVLATVVTFGYAGYLAGPAIIGVTARRVGIQHTMFVPAALCIAIYVFAIAMPQRATA